MFRQEEPDRIWCAPFPRDRRELLPLFKLADDSEQQIRSYLYLGEVIIAAESGKVIGHAQVVEREERAAFELKSIAVLKSRQRQGIGGRLIRAVTRYCRMQHATQLIVSTSIANSNAIAFYLRNGFRASAIIRDVFTTERGYPNYVGGGPIALNDAVELELVLNSTAK